MTQSLVDPVPVAGAVLNHVVGRLIRVVVQHDPAAFAISGSEDDVVGRLLDGLRPLGQMLRGEDMVDRRIVKVARGPDPLRVLAAAMKGIARPGVFDRVLGSGKHQGPVEAAL